MDQDDICNTTLDLGLGLTVKADQQNIKKTGLVVGRGLKPCLSLGLSEGPYDDTKVGMDHLSLQESVTSSGVVLKRETEMETERTSSIVIDIEDELSNTRKKLKLNRDQSAVLEESFKQHSTLNPKQKQELARKLNMRARQVEVWFQNRRARTKLKQTEVDFELLKKCWETLTDENGRLQKELQELKALKSAQPLCMPHMHAATLTTCPSCEKITSNSNNKTPKTS